MSEQFHIGQIFEGIYPPEAAIWCNTTQQGYIVELEDSKPGSRRYQIVAIQDKTEEQLLQEAKYARTNSVNNIVVTVDNMQFDGNETAQQRMMRAISTIEDNEPILWVLHDNTVQSVTKQQLQTALKLSMREQSMLWIEPYMETVSNE